MEGPAAGQQVEYVTRGNTGGHAIRFGSTPIKAELPTAYVRVNNASHTTTSINRARVVYGRSDNTSRNTDSRSNRLGLKVRFVKIHGTDHVIPTFSVAEGTRSAGASRGGPHPRYSESEVAAQGQDALQHPQTYLHHPCARRAPMKSAITTPTPACSSSFSSDVGLELWPVEPTRGVFSAGFFSGARIPQFKNTPRAKSNRRSLDSLRMALGQKIRK